MAYQRAYYPVNTLKLGQGYGSSSSTHKYSYALDLSTKQNVYAPFDCKVAKLFIKKGSSYEVWLTSTKKVLCANGYYGYMTMSITHPKNIDKLKLGQKFKQGNYVCDTSIMTGNATGPHVHMELTKGTKAGWDIIGGTYVNKDKVKPEQYLFAKKSAVIKKDDYKGKVYHFIKESEMVKRVTAKDGLNMRRQPKVSILNKIKELKQGTEVIVFDTTNGWSYIYNNGDLGYVASNYLR